MIAFRWISRCVMSLLGLGLLVCSLPADERSWAELSSGPKALENWTGSAEGWLIAGNTEIDAKNPKRLVDKSGEGVMVNPPRGRAKDLFTKEKYQDVEVHVEFMIPKGSNSGVKLMGLYEIQILDSFGKKKVSGDDCGGIYPRAEDKPNYHHIDEGTPPRVNAAKPAGEWQTLDILFVAPRFEGDKKTTNAKFVKVVLNGEVVHENVEVLYPTGAAWRLKKEVAAGPVMLQGDHGPVAFRNVRVRPYAPEK